MITLEVSDTKRRRKQDLNHRYDKMIETMQLTRIYPQRKARETKFRPTPTPRKKPGRLYGDHHAPLAECFGQDFTTIELNTNHGAQEKNIYESGGSRHERNMSIIHSPVGKVVQGITSMQVLTKHAEICFRISGALARLASADLFNATPRTSITILVICRTL